MTMNEHGRSLLLSVLQACSGEEMAPAHCQNLIRRVQEHPSLASHLWCENGCLLQDILEAMPDTLYTHEAVEALLNSLGLEVLDCLRCLQAYHTAQVCLAIHTSSYAPMSLLWHDLRQRVPGLCSKSGMRKENRSCSPS